MNQVTDKKRTPKQQRFVDEYPVDLNATKAATRAGYSPKTARQQGQRLLTNVDIAAAIDRSLKDRAARCDVDADSVINELALIGFANAGDYFDWGADGVTIKEKADLTTAQRAVVAEVSQTKTEHGGTIRVKLHDKQAALVNLGRHLGLFTDNLKLNGLEALKQLSNEQLIDRICDLITGVVDRAEKGTREPKK